MLRPFACVFALCLLAACGAGPSAEQRRLDRTYEFAKSNLLAIGTNDMAAMSYQSAVEMGATPVHYLTASMPDDADMARLLWNEPAQPWSVLIKDGPGDNDFVLEAYAEGTAAPARQETLTVTPRNPR